MEEEVDWNQLRRDLNDPIYVEHFPNTTIDIINSEEDDES